MANDEEHIAALLKAREGQEDKGYSPPVATWTPAMDMLATLTYEVRKLQSYTLAAGGSKNPPTPEPVARPKTAIDRIRARSRQERHESLANRVLARRKQKSTN